ncbi:shikimate kinase [uncultured Sphaerochaeta sp.]|uniref:shikimate kinase n=1 Tax=uncultured Sphaerochaeta sp. TaxID=886478 RepID=UPI002A0A557A|nr:shikimate kinase [uncultured Sphaerochaeta sp.]
MKEYLFFCGIKHCGKTTLGNLVAKMMGTFCVDNDDLILKSLDEGSSVRTFFKTQGKQAFMDLELRTLHSFLETNKTPCIVSLGGGACDNESLMELICSYGKSVYLKVEEPVLLKRILFDGIPPFLDGSDPQGSFARLYAIRNERYGKRCDIVVNLPDYPDVRETAKYLFARL